ncbi:MAG: hypothetical protein QW505_02685 [Thermoplasmata archaeon]
MKKSKMLKGIGGILVLVGLLITLWFGVFGDQTEKFEIPVGAEYYYYFEAPGSAVGHIKGDFSATVGTVDMYILSESQYSTYSYYGEPTSGYLYSKSGSSGTFTCNLSGSGKVYIVFDHGTGYDYIAQTVTVHLDTSAVDVAMLLPGIALVVIGAITSFYGTRIQKQEALAEKTQQPSGVVMFDEKKP